MHRRTIGYCGGIASGKSTRLRHIAQWWENSGKTLYPRVVFKTIDADVVGHKCYEPGSELYHKVVEHFSPFEKTTGSILVEATNKTDQGSSATFLPEHHHQQQVQHNLSGVKNLPIDRKKLGAIVFSDKERLKELNQIMWPAIANAVALEISNTERDILERKTQRIGSMTSTGEQCDASNDVLRKSHLVFAVEAAILPQMTEMLNMCDEVWLYHANKETAVKRVMERNKVSAEEAERRINSQMSVEEYMKLIAEAESKPFLRTFNTSGLESDSDFAFDIKKQINNFEQMLEKLEN